MENNTRNIQREPKLEKKVELLFIYEILKRRLWIIFLLTMLSTFAGYFYHSYFHSELYQSSTRIILSTDQELIKTLQAIIRDPAVLENVVNELNLNQTPEELSNQISVESVGGSQVVNIKVVYSNPESAALIANTTATVFKREVASILNFRGVTILSEAQIKPTPINNNKNSTILAAIFAGILVGVGFVFLLNALDRTLRTEQDIQEYIGLPVLGSVSRMNKKNTKRKIKSEEQNIVYRGESIGS